MGFYNPYITSHHSNPPPYDINDRDDYQPISQQQRGPYLRESSAERSRYSQSNLRSPSSGRPSPTFTALSSPGDVAQSSKLMSSEDGAIVAKMIEWVPPSPNKSPDVIRILIQPVAVPQVDVNTFTTKYPYLRAYSDVLQAHNVQITDFVAFIDHLAVAQAASPPIQLLQVAGMGIGFVPYHWAQAASGGIGLAAGVATVVVSAARTKSYMQQVNAHYFEPRCLKASLLKDCELQERIKMPGHLPLLAEADDCLEDPSIRMRRVKALKDFIAPLTLDVPPPVSRMTALDKISAKQVKIIVARNQKKAIKECKKGSKGPAEPKHVAKDLKALSKLGWIVIETLSR